LPADERDAVSRLIEGLKLIAAIHGRAIVNRGRWVVLHETGDAESTFPEYVWQEWAPIKQRGKPVKIFEARGRTLIALAKRFIESHPLTSAVPIVEFGIPAKAGKKK
jgi:hypothetical protein